MPDLLRLPHHDGSPTYVDDEAPRLGDTVTVRMRSHADDPIQDVWLRTTYDAEPVFHRVDAHARRRPRLVVGRPAGAQPGDPLPLPDRARRREPAVADRTGLVDIDVPDASDFKLVHAPAPDWARDGVVYQIFPDRFARSAAADDDRPRPGRCRRSGPTRSSSRATTRAPPVQLFGGDLDGVIEHLDHLERVGADIVYTTPVFPAESNHRYNATTFDRGRSPARRRCGVRTPEHRCARARVAASSAT